MGSTVKLRALAIVVASFLAFGVGYFGVHSAAATYDTWFQSGTYARVDNYGTHFIAQTALWYDPYTDPIVGPGIQVGRTYLYMDVTVNSPSEYLNCDVSSIQGRSQSTGWRNWFNAPFPLSYSNTPAWDYTTWNSGYTFYMAQQYGASRNEQCNSNPTVPVGAWFSKSTSGGAFSSGAWTP